MKINPKITDDNPFCTGRDCDCFKKLVFGLNFTAWVCRGTAIDTERACSQTATNAEIRKGDLCIPGLFEQRDALKAENERLKAAIYWLCDAVTVSHDVHLRTITFEGSAAEAIDYSISRYPIVSDAQNRETLKKLSKLTPELIKHGTVFESLLEGEQGGVDAEPEPIDIQCDRPDCVHAPYGDECLNCSDDNDLYEKKGGKV